MSDYHNRIMNIATEPGIEELERGDRLLYKYGHQVARHAAAEIAAEAEEEITRLQGDTEALRAKVAELETMVKVFRGCIETGLTPELMSPCYQKVISLVGRNADDQKERDGD